MQQTFTRAEFVHQPHTRHTCVCASSREPWKHLFSELFLFGAGSARIILPCFQPLISKHGVRGWAYNWPWLKQLSTAHSWMKLSISRVKASRVLGVCTTQRVDEKKLVNERVAAWSTRSGGHQQTIMGPAGSYLYGWDLARSRLRLVHFRSVCTWWSTCRALDIDFRLEFRRFTFQSHGSAGGVSNGV